MKKNYLVAYKVLFSLLGFSAVVTELAVLSIRGKLELTNFFSYFTIEANTIAFVILLVSALYVFAGKKSRKLDFLRGAVTFYMVVTGIIFSALLANIEGAELTAVPWDNTVLHYIIPIALAVDFLIDMPRRISFKKGLWWLLFPVAYLVYSLIRGASVGFYPYPFLNPALGGYGQVALTSFVVLIVGVVLVYILTRFGKKSTNKK